MAMGRVWSNFKSQPNKEKSYLCILPVSVLLLSAHQQSRRRRLRITPVALGASLPAGQPEKKYHLTARFLELSDRYIEDEEVIKDHGGLTSESRFTREEGGITGENGAGGL